MRAFSSLVKHSVQRLIENLQAMPSRWREYEEYENILNAFVSFSALSHRKSVHSDDAQTLAKYEWDLGSDFGNFVKRASPEQKNILVRMLNEDYVWDVQLPGGQFFKKKYGRDDVDMDLILAKKLNKHYVKATPLMLALWSKSTVFAKDVLLETQNPKALSVHSTSPVLKSFFPRIEERGAPVSALCMSAELIHNTAMSRYSSSMEGYSEIFFLIAQKVDTVSMQEHDFVVETIESVNKKENIKKYPSLLDGLARVKMLCERKDLERSVPMPEELEKVSVARRL